MDNAIPESTSLEYKRELNLSSRTERLEKLKDLTGMGNGGVGTVVYGDEEDDASDLPTPSAVVPLTDRGLASRLRDIVRSGVHPPLLAELNPMDSGCGYVLAVEVQPSPQPACGA